jgi:hypothetical protein
MTLGPSIIVEFYGIPRLRAERAELSVPPGTVSEALAAVQQACPGLTDLVDCDGRLKVQYLISINGREFGPSLDRPLHSGDRLLLLSADAGG